MSTHTDIIEKFQENKIAPTLGEILLTARSGQMPTHEDCYYAMIVLESLSILDRNSFMSLLRIFEKDKRVRMIVENMLERWQRSLNTAPRQYLGRNNDPMDPDTQARMAVSRKIVEKMNAKIDAKINDVNG